VRLTVLAAVVALLEAAALAATVEPAAFPNARDDMNATIETSVPTTHGSKTGARTRPSTMALRAMMRTSVR
jgi:hypothetical protein